MIFVFNIININYLIYHKMPNLLWRTHSRKYGKDSRECRRCKCQTGLIRKYDLVLCRKCFREYSEIIGFTKTRWSTDDCLYHIFNRKSFYPLSILPNYHRKHHLLSDPPKSASNFIRTISFGQHWRNCKISGFYIPKIHNQKYLFKFKY